MWISFSVQNTKTLVPLFTEKELIFHCQILSRMENLLLQKRLAHIFALFRSRCWYFYGTRRKSVMAWLVFFWVNWGLGHFRSILIHGWAMMALHQYSFNWSNTSLVPLYSHIQANVHKSSMFENCNIVYLFFLSYLLVMFQRCVTQ